MERSTKYCYFPILVSLKPVQGQRYTTAVFLNLFFKELKCWVSVSCYSGITQLENPNSNRNFEIERSSELAKITDSKTIYM